MEEVFSTSLFHYTKYGYETLIKILETGFEVGYCQEVNMGVGFDLGTGFEPSSELTIVYGTQYHPGATYGVHWFHIPMVSFCDLPTSRIDQHLSRYGQKCESTGRYKAYGIGLNQKWAARNNLKQISYEYVNNETTNKYRQVFKHSGQSLIEQIPNMGNQKIEKYCPPVPLDPESYWAEDNKGNKFPFELLYKKPINIVKISSTGNGLVRQIGPLRSETEWRYIPRNACILSSHTFNGPTINRTLYNSVEGNVKRAKAEHPGYDKLTFGPEDIEVIIADSKEDKKRIVFDLEHIGSKRQWSSVQILETAGKVLSYSELLS